MFGLPTVALSTPCLADQDDYGATAWAEGQHAALVRSHDRYVNQMLDHRPPLTPTLLYTEQRFNACSEQPAVYRKLLYR